VGWAVPWSRGSPGTTEDVGLGLRLVVERQRRLDLHVPAGAECLAEGPGGELDGGDVGAVLRLLDDQLARKQLDAIIRTEDLAVDEPLVLVPRPSSGPHSALGHDAVPSHREHRRSASCGRGYRGDRSRSMRRFGYTGHRERAAPAADGPVARRHVNPSRHYLVRLAPAGGLHPAAWEARGHRFAGVPLGRPEVPLRWPTVRERHREQPAVRAAAEVRTEAFRAPGSQVCHAAQSRGSVKALLTGPTLEELNSATHTTLGAVSGEVAQPARARTPIDRNAWIRREST
jgi:hypothetical protein